VALAGEGEIVVAIEPDLARPSGDLRAERGDGGPLRGLALLAAEPAPHAAHLAGDIGIGQGEHPGDHMLDFRGMLGGGGDVDIAFLARHRERGLPLQVEMLLPADAQRSGQPVRALRDRGSGIAAPETVIGEHGLVARLGILDRDRRALGIDLDMRLARRAPGGVAGRRHDGEERLAVEIDLALGEHRIIAHGRGDVVGAGYVGGGEHHDDTGRLPHGAEIERGDAPARLGRHADGDMQGALGLADIVDVMRSALHVPQGRIMRQGLPHMPQWMLARICIRSFGLARRCRRHAIHRRICHCRSRLSFRIRIMRFRADARGLPQGNARRENAKPSPSRCTRAILGRPQ